jgi:hypothetical protein
VASLCRRALLLHEGRLVEDGDTASVLGEYQRLLPAVGHVVGPFGEVVPQVAGDAARARAEIEAVELSGSGGGLFRSGAGVVVSLRVRARERLDVPRLIVAVTAADGRLAYQHRVEVPDGRAERVEPGQALTIRLRICLNLVPGQYTMALGVQVPGSTELLAWKPAAASFFVEGREGSRGVAELGAEVVEVTVSDRE